MLKKIIYAGLIVLVFVIIFFGAWLNSSFKAKKISIVYLSTKEIYIGHLHTFPRMVLTDAYMLETAQDVGEDGKISQKLVSLTNPKKVWASDELHLNRDQILFYGTLTEGTEVEKAIKDKKAE